VLTGDFNETEWSHPYELLTELLEDSFRDAGRGFGHTYPSQLTWRGWRIAVPLVRIDYIFHSADLAAPRAWVGPHGGSDHLPVVAELAFR
jgi:endonuclease/exonuclease/phosphatase (EEP) superfamily protein YafD